MSLKIYSAIVLIIISLLLWIALEKSNEVSSQHSLASFLTEQIQEDLLIKPIDKQSLDTAWDQISHNTGYVRYKLIKGKFTAAARPSTKKHSRYVVITKALNAIFSSATYPDLDFIVSLGDFELDNPLTAPIFTFAKHSSAKKLILMPDFEALNKMDRSYLKNQILQSNKNNLWINKQDVLYWRGSSTGPIFNAHMLKNKLWLKSARFYLVHLSEKYPEYINAHFVRYCQMSQDSISKIASIMPLAQVVHPKDHLIYKYLIDVDGNSCCYSRTYWILLSNSVALKQKTENIQWFYKGLKPYIHFVPLCHDLHDLIEKIEWCKLHDNEVRKISERASQLALSCLSYEENIHYLSDLLIAYSACLTFSPLIDKEDQQVIDKEDQQASISLIDKTMEETMKEISFLNYSGSHLGI